MVFIYVLQLSNGKYYVGKTTNPYFRLESHFNSDGSEWTKLYKPIKVLELISNCDDYDEDKYTRIYMDKYGIDNVRGGSYTSVNLDKYTKNHLIKISNSTNNRCFKCGKDGHFAKDCNNKNNINNGNNSSEYTDDTEDSDDSYDVVWCCSYCNKEFEEKEKCIYHENKCKSNKSFYSNSCFKCGKYGHYANNCRFNKYSKSKCSNKCDICGKYGHYEVNCYNA